MSAGDIALLFIARALRVKGTFWVVHVRTGQGSAGHKDVQRLSSWRMSLGGHAVELSSESVAEEILKFAAARWATFIVRARLRPSLNGFFRRRAARFTTGSRITL